jgi:hypothetical protein
MGSSAFQQRAIKTDGAIKVNRSFTTSEANLRAAFADEPGEIHVHLEAGELAPLGRGGNRAAGNAGSLFTSQGQRLDRQRRG